MQLKNKLMTVGCVAVAAAALVAGTACNEHELSPFSKSLSSGKKQSSSAGSARPVDILFVVDDSISMTEEQSDLDSNFKIFLDRLIEANADFRLATVSTSYTGSNMRFITNALDTGASILQSDKDKNITSADIKKIKDSCKNYYSGQVYSFKNDSWEARTKNADKYESLDWISYSDFNNADVGFDSDNAAHVEKRQQLIHDLFRCQAIMGITGDATEKGLASMKSALSHHRDLSAGEHRNDTWTGGLHDEFKNFKRPGSILAVVFVTDENDCSSTTTLLSGNQCEVNRNIEDSCVMTREDSIQINSEEADGTTYLQLSTGQSITYNDVTKSLRDWCVSGDDAARKALQACLEDSECKAASYIKCPDGGCKNELAPRRDYYRFLIDYVIASNEANYVADNPELLNTANIADFSDRYAKLETLAQNDIIVASIINRDQGIRYDSKLPENWCGTAGSQGYRYQLFAEMFQNSPLYAPICCKNEGYVVKQVSMEDGKKTSKPAFVCDASDIGTNGAFGPVLSVIGQRIGEAVNTLCADAAPISCKPADCNEADANGGYTNIGRADKAAACPCMYGCNASAPHMANTPNEYYLCNEFQFNVGSVNSNTKEDYRAFSDSDFSIDYDSAYCKTRTGSPIQINLSRTEINRDLVFEYPKAVSGR